MDKMYAWVSGMFSCMFIEAAWYLPDVRIHEGLPWWIELSAYIVTLTPAIYFTYLALKKN